MSYARRPSAAAERHLMSADRVAFPRRSQGPQTAAGIFRHLAWVLLATTAWLTGCQGTDDLSRAGCLPLRVPAAVVLQRETGLYRIGDAEVPVLTDHPRDTRNDASQRRSLLRTVPPGTRVTIDRLTQRWGFDSGKGRISAFGTLPSGERFEYGWGTGSVIGPAPWEGLGLPNLRTVKCHT